MTHQGLHQTERVNNATPAGQLISLELVFVQPAHLGGNNPYQVLLLVICVSQENRLQVGWPNVLLVPQERRQMVLDSQNAQFVLMGILLGCAEKTFVEHAHLESIRTPGGVY
jgi:hypothetical protein